MMHPTRFGRPNIGGLLRNPAFDPDDPLKDKDGEHPSLVASLLFIQPPDLKSPSPLTVVRHQAFNAGAEVGAGRGLLVGAVIGIGLSFVFWRLVR